MLDAKLLKPRSLMEKDTAYRARWLLGTFEKRAPGPDNRIATFEQAPLG